MVANHEPRDDEQRLIDLLSEMESKQIKLWVEDDSLCYKAPKGAITGEISKRIQACKDALIRRLRREDDRKLLFESIPLVEEAGYYPLSPAQKRMYVLNRMDPDSTAYNIVNVLKIEGDLDQERMVKVFEQIIDRHESLRTSFELNNGVPVQRVHPQVNFRPQYRELYGTEAEIDGLIEEFIRPFDLSQAPLFRLMAVKLTKPDGAVNIYLFLDMSHIISDGASGAILAYEFNTLYSGKTLPQLKIQYKDYSAWYQELLSGQAIQLQRHYWKTEFQNEIPVLDLPTDFPRPAVFTFQGGVVSCPIDPPLTAGLRRLAREHKVTLYTVLLSVYYALLFKYSGQNDIVVGTPTAGRRHEDLHPVIGMFVNTLALKNSLAPEKSFQEFLKETGKKVVKAFDNQDYPFEQLVEELNLPRDPGRNPIFDTMFVLQNISIDGVTGQGLKSVPYRINRGLILFDLRLEATETEAGIELEIHYCSSLFKKETMERLGGHFLNLLGQSVRDPQILLGEMELITEAEKRQILNDFNNTMVEYPKCKTIHGLIEEQAIRTPDSLAVIYPVQGPEGFETRTMNYRELNERANRLANYLHLEQGVNPGSLAGILLERSGELMVALLGVLKAGGAYVPIDPGYPEERIKTIINDAGLSIIVSGKKHLKTLNRLQWECPTFRTYICLDSEAIHAEKETEKNDLMDEKLWNYIGGKADDPIAGGGWVSSYTGEAFTREEMEEYSENILAKLKPYLNPNVRVLEIGTASGLSMFRIAPWVGFYYGTDISREIIEKNRLRIKAEGIENIYLECRPAHEIDKIDREDFDIVIINSVIHCFHGHNYLRNVIKKAIGRMKTQGVIFAGDILDQGLKDNFIRSLVQFQQKHQGAGYRTKTDFSAELFVSREFFEDLRADLGTITHIDFTPKIHRLQNELTRYRYDALIRIDRSRKPENSPTFKHKYQHDAVVLEKYRGWQAPPIANSSYPAYVIYTSGSTGKPKGALIEHDSIINRLNWMQRKYPIGPGDVILQKTPYTFDVSVWELFWWAIQGAQCCFLIPGGEKDPEAILQAIEENKVTTIHFVPSMLSLFLEHLENGADLNRLASLRRVFASGEALNFKQVNKFNQLLNQKGRVFLHNLYGPTEATVDVSYYDCPTGEAPAVIPIGKPIDNIQLCILNNHGQLQPIGVPGELHISGAGVGRGYLNRPELTAEKFVSNPFEQFRVTSTRFRVDNQNQNQVETSRLASCAMNGAVTRNSQLFYKTGDLARWLPDGNIEYLGRLDHQIKIRGFRIELGEIEAVLLKHPAIMEAVALVKEELDGAKYICACISGEEELTLSQLRLFLQNELPEYMIPAHFVYFKSLPTLPNGKIDRKALAQAREGELNSGVCFETPGTEVEIKIGEIWREILGRNRIGIYDNFFELGGHSLKAITMAARIHRELQVETPLSEVFNRPTIKALAEYISTQSQTLFSGIRPVEPREYYPLSSAQKRLFVLDQMEGPGVTYNMPGIMLIEGNLNRIRFARAIDELIQRHEALRTSIEFVNGEPVQRVWPAQSLPGVFRIEYWDIGDENGGAGDWNGCGHSGAGSGSIGRIIREFIRPFDLSQAPLLRFGLIGLGEDRHLLMYDMSHIISDGVSIEILIQEFTALYEGKQLPELRLQYKDFAVWQGQQLESAVMKKQEEYWLSIFRDQAPVLEIYCDFPRPASFTYQGSSLNFEADPALAAKLSTVTSRIGGTLYMTLLGAFNLLLSKYSGQEDIVIGSLTAGRPHADLQNIIGMFVNTIAVRNYPEGNKTIGEFLREVKAGALQSFENQDYPFEALVEKLDIQRDLSRNPIFDTMFVLQNQDTGGLALEGLKISRYPFEHPIAKFDLTLYAVESAGKILFTLEYCTSLFKRETIQRLAEHYLNTLGEITANLSLKIRDLEIMSAEEKHRLLVKFNDTEAEYPTGKTIQRLFEEQVARTPANIALIFEGTWLTYRELNEKANRLARVLINQGVKPDTIVGIMIERSVEMMVGLLGILKSGAAYLPIDPEYPKERIKFILEDSRTEILLTGKRNGQNIEFGGVTIDIKNGVPEDGNCSNLGETSVPENLAYVIYTSGSTGKPKGALIEHYSVINRLNWMQRKYPIGSGDVILQKTPFTFDVSVWELFWWAIQGAKCCFLIPGGEKDPEVILQAIEENKVTTIHFVPPMLGLFLEYLETGPGSTQAALNRLASLRRVFVSGEALSLIQANKFNHLLKGRVYLHNLYGPTEATVDVSYYDCPAGEITQGIPIGKPIDNIQLYILNNHGRLQPLGVPGELCISGAGVGRGYLNRPELTVEKFVSNPFYTLSERAPQETPHQLYRTGDLARWLPEGEVEYLGRIDHQVKIRGNRIELGEIEMKLLQHEAIKEAVVITRENEINGKYLCAYLVSSAKLAISELRGYLAETLPDYMIPSFFIQLETLPLTPNGKLDRKALASGNLAVSGKWPEPDGDFGAVEEYEAPANAAQEKMARVWQEVLGVERIGIRQNFFTLGGDSMKAVRLVTRMNGVLGTNIKLRDLYLHQNIADLSSKAGNLGEERIEESLQNGRAIIERLRQGVLEDPKQAANLPRNIEDFYPLSQIQQGMVFYSRLRPEEPIYHDQFPYFVKVKEFHFDTYLKAISLLSRRHPILRTTFDVERFSQPFQIVHQDLQPDIRCEDLSFLPANQQEDQIKAYLLADLKNKFNFQGDLLWRMRLFKLDDVNYCIVLSCQHAILDGWSVAYLTAELFRFYHGLIRGEAVAAQELKSSYKDYVAINLSRKTNEKNQEFWKNTLAGSPRTKLPFNISNRKINNTTGSKIYRKRLGPELLEALDKQAKNRQCTLKEICLSAHIYLLGIITTDSDIITGAVTHDRPAVEDSEKILGCFLNTIPVRITVDKEINKLELLNKVRDYMTHVKSHELFLAEIAGIIGEVNHNGNPIFDTLFNFIDFHVLEATERTDIAFRSDDILDIKSSEMTNTLFDLEVSKTLNNFEMQVKYSPNYFHDKDIETAVRLYVRILEKYAGDGGFITSEDLITRQEKEELLYGFNNTLVTYPNHKTMHRLFEEQAGRSPGNVALVFDGETMTYGELEEKSNRVAKVLVRRGVRPGDHVALIMGRSFEMIVGMLGILKAGGAYVPIDPDYPAARKEFIVRHSNVTAVVAGMVEAGEEEGFCFENMVPIDCPEIWEQSASNPEIEMNPKQLAYIIYTSGSTGNPKGVMIEHHSAVNLITWVNKEFGVNENDRLLFITSMCFDLSVYDIFGILAAGGSIIIAKKEQVQSPWELKNLMRTERITFWDSVPTTMNYLVDCLEEDGADYLQQDLRLVFLSGDWIPVKLPDRVRKFFPNTRVISLGGATEGTVWSIYYPIETVSEYQTSIPYGRPIDNNYFYILDENLNPVPRGVAGELYIGGVGVARGYVNDEERTRASFMGNKFLDPDLQRLYKTGDLGRMMPDGNIEFLGRVDHQVKIRGFRVELGEIENQLLTHPAVKEAVVADGVDTGGNKYLAAYLVSQGELPGAEIREYLSKRIPDYMIPAYVIKIEKVPLTPNGKVDRKALPDPVLNISAKQDFEAPNNPIERDLFEIWKEVLEADGFGVNDNFFELGGHSLKATLMVSKIHRIFNVQISLQEVFANSTIKELGKCIKDAAVNRYASIRPAKEKEYYALSSAQKRLFILDQLKRDENQKDGDTSYNISMILTVEGRLDRKRLEAVFKEVTERHEVFRTSFELVDGEPVQRVHPSVDLRIGFMDATGLLTADDEKNNEDKIKEMVAEFIRPFDLKKAPLLRVCVVKLAPGKFLFMLDVHHIIADGVSMAILLQEFNRLYDGQQLPTPRIQYKDFSEWQNDLLESGLIKNQEEYWVKLFSGPVPKLNLPTDYPRPSVQSFAGAELGFKVDRELTEKLKELASKTGATMYMVLLAVFNILLHKSTGAEDIVVGSSIAGRPHADLENVVGMFVNMLAMRNYPNADLTFEDFLKNVRETVLRALDNQDYQFEKLVDKLNLKRDSSRNPLFDVVFVLQNIRTERIEAGDLKFTPYQSESKISKFDLTFYATETENGIDFIIEYCTALFKKETIEELARRYLRIIKSITGCNNLKIREIEFYDAEKARSILEEIHQTQEQLLTDINF